MSPKTDIASRSKTYVLSIAINQYRSADVSDLAACEKDVDQLKTVLQTQFKIPEEQYLVLKNEAATRANILRHFRHHFGQLEDGDTAVLHYSGHGSWEDTSPAFIEAGIEHFGGRNEVMVVYDYGDLGVRNIADKELRWLISEVQTLSTGQRKNISFIGLMDCCYSGSIFRSEEYLIRRTELSNTEARPLSEYLEGQYERQYQKEKSLHLPDIDYVMLSACGPKEYALETDKGGLFTQCLITTISQARNRSLSYAELFFHVRHQIQANSNARQHPYLHYHGSIHPYQHFLGSPHAPPPTLPQLVQRGNSWVANIGALQGVQASSWRRADIPVYPAGQYTQAITYAKLKQVALEYTLLSLDLPSGINPDTARLEAGLHGTPLAIKWEIDPDSQAIADRLKLLLHESGLGTQLYTQEDSAYRLRVQQDQISIWRAEDLITGVYLAEDRVRALGFIQYGLSQIVRWEQVRGLQTPIETTVSLKKIDFSFFYLDADGEKRFIKVSTEIQERANSQIIIPYHSNNPYIFYNINIENKDVYPVYTYLLHLRRQFGIQQKLQDYIKPLRYEDQLSYHSAAEQKALAITDPSISQTTDRFILIASREPLFAPHLLEQAGLGAHFGKIISTKDLQKPYKAIGEKSSLSQITNWAIQQLEVILVRT